MNKGILAIILSSFAMLCTTGLMALATAAPAHVAPEDAALAAASAELEAQLDQVLVAQLGEIKARLQR